MLDAGFDGHLPKPIDQAMLTSILRDIGEHRDTDVHRPPVADRRS